MNNTIQYNTIQSEDSKPIKLKKRNETEWRKKEKKKQTNVCVLSWKILQPNANAKLWRTIQHKLKPNLTSDLLFVVSQRSCLFVWFGSKIDRFKWTQYCATNDLPQFDVQLLSFDTNISINKEPFHHETKRNVTSNDWRIMIR